MPWLGFRKQQLTEELKLCDKVGHNVNLSLICVALQKGRGTTEERAVQRECRQPENSSLGVWDTFPVFLNPIQSEGVSKSNSPWIFPFIKTLCWELPLRSSLKPGQARNPLHMKNSVLFTGAMTPWQEALVLFIVYLFTGSSRSKLLLKESRPSELREI